tara:strand:+ start:185 stop:544 length:360 start_codon:yes stop_codon:yes gene_type:complete
MAIVAVQLNFPSINVSTQVGDIVYYSSGTPSGGFNTANTANTFMLGPIISIGTGSIIITYDNVMHPAGIPIGSYISVVKNKEVNTSSLVGYYASVNFVNNSYDNIELFSVGAEVTESSK